MCRQELNELEDKDGPEGSVLKSLIAASHKSLAKVRRRIFLSRGNDVDYLPHDIEPEKKVAHRTEVGTILDLVLDALEQF